MNDDKIVKWCKFKKISFYRGSEENVLNRVYLAAKKNKLDIVVLITGDCPLVDHGIISQVLSTYLNNKADYVSISLKVKVEKKSTPLKFNLKPIESIIDLEEQRIQHRESLPSRRQHCPPGYLSPWCKWASLHLSRGHQCGFHCRIMS